MGFQMSPHPLTNFEIQKYFQNDPRFNRVFSINNLPERIKDGPHVINLDEYADVGTHWIDLLFNGSEIAYFDSFGVEYVPEEIKELFGNKNLIVNNLRLQANSVWVLLHWIHWFYASRVKNWMNLQACFLPMTLKRTLR